MARSMVVAVAVLLLQVAGARHDYDRQMSSSVADVVQEFTCIMDQCRYIGHEYEIIELLPLLRWAAGRKPGTFVELGAYDGRESSQTWVLEKCFNWTGVLIEASPVLFERLKKVDRPRSHKVWASVCPAGQKIHMTAFNGTIGDYKGGSPSVLTAVEHVTSAYKKAYGKWLDVENTVEVPCREMSDILAEAGLEEVDFISVDVQGAEDAVLNASNLGLVHGQPTMYKVVLAESESTHEAKNMRVRAMLRESGLLQIPHTYQPQKKPGGGGYNELFVRPSLVAPTYDPSTKQYGHQRFPILYPDRLSGASVAEGFGGVRRFHRYVDGVLAMDAMDAWVRSQAQVDDTSGSGRADHRGGRAHRAAGLEAGS